MLKAGTTSARKVVSRSKFTKQMFKRLAEQNFLMCAQTVFLTRFCELRKKSCNACHCLTLYTQFFTPLRSVLAESCVSVCASSYTDTIQTKKLILYGQKFCRTKVPSSEKWRNWPVFWPWVLQEVNMLAQAVCAYSSLYSCMPSHLRCSLDLPVTTYVRVKTTRNASHVTLLSQLISTAMCL